MAFVFSVIGLVFSPFSVFLHIYNKASHLWAYRTTNIFACTRPASYIKMGLHRGQLPLNLAKCLTKAILYRLTVDGRFWEMNPWSIFGRQYLLISVTVSKIADTFNSRLTETTWHLMLQWCQEFRRHSRTIYQVIVRCFLSSSFEKMKDISDKHLKIWLGWKDPRKWSNLSELSNLYSTLNTQKTTGFLLT